MPTHMQAFGLSEPKFILGGTLTGAAADYWDVLWPHATNTVSVGFLLRSRSLDHLQPTQVTNPFQLPRRWKGRCNPAVN